MTAEVLPMVRGDRDPPPPPPYNVEAEQALLGAILVANEAFWRVADFLEPGHFFEGVHQRIYDFCAEFIRSGRVATPVTLRTAFADAADRDLGGVTVSQYLARLAAEATTVINAEDYGRTVLDLAVRRDLMRIADELAARARAEDLHRSDHAAELGAELMEAIASATDPGRASMTPRVTIGEAAARAMAAAEEARRTERRLPGATTGIPSLDRMTPGFVRGQTVVIGGRTGMGKSTVGLALALKTARAGHGAYFVSLEMGDVTIGARALASIASGVGRPIVYEQILRGQLDDSEVARLRRAEEELATLPIIIEQEPNLSVGQIAARARRVRQALQRRGADLEVLFVDHFGLIRAEQRRDNNKAAEATDIAGALLAAAKTLGACVVNLVQISREAESRGEDRRPAMRDLKWTGALEENADVILLLYREGYYLSQLRNPTPEQTDRAVEVQTLLEANVAKNRHGRTGHVDLYCQIGAGVVDELHGGYR